MEQYSRVEYPAMRNFKKMFKKSNLKYEDYVHEIKQLVLKNSGNNWDIAFNEYGLIDMIVRRNYTNYYINSKELSKFLKNTEIKDEIFKDFPKIIYNNFNFKDDRQNENLKIGGLDCFQGGYFFSGAIHTKTEERTIFFSLTINGNKERPYLICSNGDDVSNLPLYGESKDRTNLKSNTYHSIMMKLVLNMVFYMSAFPEYILDTPPDEVKDKLNINNSKTITLSKEISDYMNETRDVMPHLRRGHFKFLGSEYYKKKRGQTIFVKPTFVKGDAKTVISGGEF